jgi:UDP-glucose 4-epimerase
MLNNRNDVVIVDDFSTGKMENIADLPVTIIKHDITKPYEALRFTINNELWEKDFDVIFHLAAKARIQPSFKDPKHTFDVNSSGTLNILEFARNQEKQPKIVFAGTSSIYHDINANPYTYSKWVSEQHIKHYCELWGLKGAIARFFNVYGPNSIYDGPYATVIAIFEKQKEANTPLTITGTGEQRRDFTHVYDIVDGLIKLAEIDKDITNNCKNIFNFGTGTNHSINEVAEMFNHPYEYIPKRPGEAETTLADNHISKHELQWDTKHKLEDYVKEFISKIN